MPRVLRPSLAKANNLRVNTTLSKMIAAADGDGVLTHSLTLFFTFMPDLMKNKIFTWSDFSLLSTIKQRKDAGVL